MIVNANSIVQHVFQMRNEKIKHINVNIKIIVSDKMIIVAYMPSHPRLAGGTRIENVQPLPPAFCLNHTQSFTFCLMETNFPRQIFSQE